MSNKHQQRIIQNRIKIGYCNTSHPTQLGVLAFERWFTPGSVTPAFSCCSELLRDQASIRTFLRFDWFCHFFGREHYGEKGLVNVPSASSQICAQGSLLAVLERSQGLPGCSCARQALKSQDYLSSSGLAFLFAKYMPILEGRGLGCALLKAMIALCLQVNR